MKFSHTQTTLLGILSQALTGKQFHIPVDTDWAELYRLSKAQAVAPMAFSCVAEQCADKEVFAKWKSFAMRSLQNNMNIHVQHAELHNLLTKQQIPYCIIKGCASAKDYPDPLMRAMGDVDFIILEQDWERALKALTEEGFLVSGEDHAFHISLSKKNVHMEMHHDPFGIKVAKADALAEIIPDLVYNSVEVKSELGSFRMPDDFGHGIVILLHAYRHLVDAGIGIRHLCDWAALISRYSNEEFISVFQNRFCELGIWRLAQVFGATAHRYLNIPYQPWMGEKDAEVCEMLMQDILNSGNFGRNDADRWTQNKAIYNVKNQISENNGMKQLIHTLNQNALEVYPRAMKCVLLRPFGWIVLGIRYLFRVCTGRRKKVSSDFVKTVNMRKNLYQQLRAFQTE